MFYTVHLFGVQELILGEGPDAMILLATEVLMKVESDAASKVSIVAGSNVQIVMMKTAPATQKDARSRHDRIIESTMTSWRRVMANH